MLGFGFGLGDEGFGWRVRLQSCRFKVPGSGFRVGGLQV